MSLPYWTIPLAITIGALLWLNRPTKHDDMFGVSALFDVSAAVIIVLVSWLIWALVF